MYEDKYRQQHNQVVSELNSKEQVERGAYYYTEYWIRHGEVQQYLADWEALEKLYKCERDELPGCPNSFVPVLNPIIAGQCAALVEKNVQAAVRGEGVSDQGFASTGQIMIDLILKRNNIKQVIKDLAKDYLLKGTCCLGIHWNADLYRGNTGATMGFPEFRVIQPNLVYVDGKIKNIRDYQKSEYIIEEVGFKSINWIRTTFGDKAADNVVKYNHVYPYDGAVSYDDMNASSLLYVWTKNNKYNNLQRIVMDKRGLIIDESDEKSPYYEYVNNEYPFAFAGLYKEEGHFYRFGDGKLLKPLQETINKLFDELVTACMFNSQPRTFVDPNAQCDLDQFDNDPSHPIVVTRPNETIRIAPAAGINPVIQQLISMLMQEAQKCTRFSSLMSGNNPEERMTATQAGIQVQQGNNTINDKREDISNILEWGCKYALGLIMEFWTAAQGLRIVEDKDEFTWVDPRQLTKVPILVPRNDKFLKQWVELHPNSPPSECPKWMQLEVDNEDATKSVDFDIKMTIGEGLPNNKVALYNMLLSLAQLQLFDEQSGQPKPVISRDQFIKMAEDWLGVNLEQEEIQRSIVQPQSQMQAQQKSLNINPNIPGANLNGGNIGGYQAQGT